MCMIIKRAQGVFMKILLPIIALLAMASCGVIQGDKNHPMIDKMIKAVNKDYKPDNATEEATEEIIEEITGLEVDLSPNVGSKDTITPEAK